MDVSAEAEVALEVVDTADGFEASRYYLAAGGFLLLALAWVRTKVSLDRFLDSTNAEIAGSFAPTPPPLHTGEGAQP